MLTWPGIAKPNENKKKSTFPVIVNIREIAKAAKLANNNVKNTDPKATITEFLNGVATLPVSKSVLKLFRLKAFGHAKGLE